jgi:flagellar biosynthesis component FlhA
MRQDVLERLLGALHTEIGKSEVDNLRVTLLADDMLRRPLRNTLERSLGDLAVISYSEIPTDLMIEQVAILDTATVFGVATSDPPVVAATMHHREPASLVGAP